MLFILIWGTRNQSSFPDRLKQQSSTVSKIKLWTHAKWNTSQWITYQTYQVNSIQARNVCNWHPFQNKSNKIVDYGKTHDHQCFSTEAESKPCDRGPGFCQCLQYKGCTSMVKKVSTDSDWTVSWFWNVIMSLPMKILYLLLIAIWWFFF